MGISAVMHACLSGNLDLVKYLVEEKEADLTILDTNNRSPLNYACLSGNLDLVKYLVEERKIKIDQNAKLAAINAVWIKKSNHLDLLPQLLFDMSLPLELDDQMAINLLKNQIKIIANHQMLKDLLKLLQINKAK